MLSAISRQFRPLVGRFSGALPAVTSTDLVFSQSSTLAKPAALGSVAEQRRYASDINTISTYIHDQEYAAEQLFPRPKRWPQYNNIVHNPDDGPVERYYNHFRDNIKYSPKKMWYCAAFVRGMSVDEAIKQLTYINRKGAFVIREILEEAREIAMAEHNFEFKSKMWIAESFMGKGFVMKGFRKHARMRFGEVRYKHVHYFVKLVEGEPPKDYLPSPGPQVECMTIEDRLNQHIEKLRKRRIDFAL